MLAAGVSLAACADPESVPAASARPRGTPAPSPQGAAAGSAGGGQDSAEPFPWEPAETVRGELAHALGQQDWPTLLARIPPAISLMRYPNGVDLQEMTPDQFVTWLRARWSAGIAVQEPRFVPHFPSLEVPTTGWRATAPSGTTIHLVHHVNPDTRRWFLDVVQYE